MIILGIDPGTRVAGYGVIETARAGGAARMLECGEIRMAGSLALPLRLKTLYDKLAAVVERTAPDECAIESAFYHKNVRSTLVIGHARGVALLAAAQRQIPVAEYSPREIKKSVTGNGAASKEQVRFMVRKILNIRKQLAILDVSDALAVAVCHQQRRHAPAGAAKTWRQFVETHPERIVRNARRATSPTA